jgi:hypothetical protein
MHQTIRFEHDYFAITAKIGITEPDVPLLPAVARRLAGRIVPSANIPRTAVNLCASPLAF